MATMIYMSEDAKSKDYDGDGKDVSNDDKHQGPGCRSWDDGTTLMMKTTGMMPLTLKINSWIYQNDQVLNSRTEADSLV